MARPERAPLTGAARFFVTFMSKELARSDKREITLLLG
jgi:hypothetical protein